MKKYLLLLGIFCGIKIFPQGTWTPLTNYAPDANGGVMLLLPSGKVMAKTYSGGSDSYGNMWNILTPDTTGSYINGTWTQSSSMIDTRLYFSTQVLQDGRVYVGGGEYGTGGSSSEMYDPQNDAWTALPAQGNYIGDANSEILPDGRILQALLYGSFNKTAIYDPKTNAWVTAQQACHGGHDETTWLKLPDGSILFVDIGTKNSERFIPATNQWIADANVPDSLYDSNDFETGPSFLLPDGRAFFIGGLGHTAFYTPSGSTSAGTWAAGPDVPGGYVCSDASGAMMSDGKILFTASPVPKSFPDFPSPTAYFEFDYTNNSYLQLQVPDGSGLDTAHIPCFVTNMLDLPDGTVLYCNQGEGQYYVYTPAGAQLAAGMPTVGNITQITCDTFRVTGTLFNGISEGASYGDDWQMSTNRPIVRLAAGPYVYYCRTFGWNRTDVQTSNLADTTYFIIPNGLQPGMYDFYVSANGISSSPGLFIYSTCTTSIQDNTSITDISLFPNPAEDVTTLSFRSEKNTNYTIRISDLFGRIVKEETGISVAGNNSHKLNLTGLAAGAYYVVVRQANVSTTLKMILK